MPTIGMDNCLFIEELPEEKQPGTHVRRIGWKELNDEESLKNKYRFLMIENEIRLWYTVNQYKHWRNLWNI